jgi:two-component system response regulator BaeR
MSSSTPGQHILIVEDEPKLARILENYLHSSGFTTSWLDDGGQAVAWIRDRAPDLVLLDIMLPGSDGIEICRATRAFSEVPIIMVTARVEEVDRLLGLELGADDYICKPYSPREVVARVKTVLRRAPREVAATANEPLAFDPPSHRLRSEGREVQLTTVESQLFEAMYREPGRIFTRGQLIDRIYDDYRVVSERTVDSHIKKLRKKLQELVPDQEFIQSVYGAGYRYEANPRARD